MSAAFPGGFGPLTLDARRFEWRKRPWDAPPDAAQTVQAVFPRLHLYDGGVYDNMGIEPFFDAGKQRPKQEGFHIICSDAGALLAPGFEKGPLNVFRLTRVADVMSDQSRSLRVRTFSHFLQQSPSAGAYLCINMAVSSSESCPSAQFAASFPTTLRRLRSEEFDRLASHGAAVAERGLGEFELV